MRHLSHQNGIDVNAKNMNSSDVIYNFISGILTWFSSEDEGS